MSDSKKKKEAAEAEDSKAANIPLSQYFLDCKKDKYRLVPLAIRWAVEVKGRDQESHETPTEILDKALKEILSGQVTLDTIEKMPPPPKIDKKAEAAKISEVKLEEEEKKPSAKSKSE